MIEIDFSDPTAANKWLNEQSQSARQLIASRAALRSMACIGNEREPVFSKMALAALRAQLTSAAYSWQSHKRFIDADSANAASAGISAVAKNFALSKPADAARSSIAAAVRTSASSILIAINRSADAVSAASVYYEKANSALQELVHESAMSAATWDSGRPTLQLFKREVWAGTPPPKSMLKYHDAFIERLSAEQAWHFWLRFYDGIWKGNYTDWDLAFEVIKIEEKDWERGYEHIGGVIAEIEVRMGN